MPAPERAVLVDSSVLISWLGGYRTPEVVSFRAAMQSQREVYLSPLCAYESTVGIRDAAQREQIMQWISALPMLPSLPPECAWRAVELHHATKRDGQQNSNTVDLILAGLALALDMDFLTEEKWFARHAVRHGLRVL